MRYDPIADFAYHLGYSYGEAEEMLTTHEKKSNEKEFKKKVKVEKRTDTKDNKNVLPELETLKVDIKNIDEVTSYTGLKTNNDIESIVKFLHDLSIVSKIALSI